MKSLLLAAGLLCTLGLGTASAQVIIPNVGLHGYLTERVALADVNADTEIRGRSGYQFGLDYRTSKKLLYLQPGVHYYSTKTRVVDLREVGLSRERADQRHTMLKVPVLAGVRIGLNGVAAVHLQGGPVLTASLNEELTDDLGGQSNFAFGMGTGVAVDLLKFHALVRYEFGMTQAFKNQPGNADVLSVGIGLVF